MPAIVIMDKCGWCCRLPKWLRCMMKFAELSNQTVQRRGPVCKQPSSCKSIRSSSSSSCSSSSSSSISSSNSSSSSSSRPGSKGSSSSSSSSSSKNSSRNSGSSLLHEARNTQNNGRTNLLIVTSRDSAGNSCHGIVERSQDIAAMDYTSQDLAGMEYKRSQVIAGM